MAPGRSRELYDDQDRGGKGVGRCSGWCWVGDLHEHGGREVDRPLSPREAIHGALRFHDKPDSLLEKWHFPRHS